MDLATVLSIVQTILTAIQTLDQLKSTFSLSKYKDELERLEKTVSIVQSVLVDADDKQGALSRQQMIYIEKLKDAIYDANDVLDEFVTLVKQGRVEAVPETHIDNLSRKVKNVNKKLDEIASTSSKFLFKVRSFLSRFNLRIDNLSRKVENVNKKLDEIASTSSKFLFKVDNKPKRFIKPDSYSFVAENDIIGRDKELKKIVGMLVNSNGIVDQANNVSCLAIVGMGGLGKTAFAQLVYNDPRVSSAFQLRRWICIADQDQWNLTEILGKIVKVSISDRHDSRSLEQMHLKIKKQLEGKKYLLVLDDVWTESYHMWQDLEKILTVGASGSHIIVTTRSKKTAKIIADNRVHELQGLPKEQSWRLFERTAFLPGQRENLDDDLVQLGKEIVKKCKNVPLAIRVVASLLRGEPKLKWISFRDKELANISESDDTISKILKLSYHHLDFSLKSCFSYCAIFPKDFVIDKQMLISLWMAQGYISAENVGEEYFLILLQRCFFQDLEMNEWGEISQFKIHDLLHDVAEQVAGKDICRLSSDAFGMSERVHHHLSLLPGYCPQETFYNSHIRTCVQVRTLRDESSSAQLLLLVGNKIANWACLRSLDLSDLCAKSIPESIGELFHLRYLNLSRSKLYVLPVSITKLVNLQTLDLSDCNKLLELPKNVGHLLDLSTLNLTNCTKLSHMPSGMGSLTYLHTLGMLVVGRRTLEGKHCFEALEDLRHMSNLKGFLEVRVWVDNITNYVKEDHGKGAFLSNKEGLKTLRIMFETLDILDGMKDIPFKDREYAQGLLEDLQPHHDLKELKLEGYIGEIMPRWRRRGDNLGLFHLPNLVTLNISDCFFLRCLPPLGDLPRLKFLTLHNLPNVEYVLDAKPEGSSFPSLQELKITGLGELKGWWPRLRSGLQKEHLVVSLPVPCFPQLKHLNISNSLMLDSFPVSSNLEKVKINIFSRGKVWDHIHVLRDFLLKFTASDSKTRMMCICDFESNINNDIDTKLTTALHHWIGRSQADLYDWGFRHGYEFLGPYCQG